VGSFKRKEMSMGVQRGRDLLIKLRSSADQAYTSLAGLRASNITFNTRPVDVTSNDSQGRWREFFAESGVRSIAISGSCLMKNQDSDIALKDLFIAGRAADFEIILPAFCRINGPFVVTVLRYAGTFDGEMRSDIEIQSSGAIHVVAL